MGSFWKRSFKNSPILSHWLRCTLVVVRSWVRISLPFFKWVMTSPTFFKKWAIPCLFFFIFVFYIQLRVNNVQYKFCRWLDLNHGPLVLEATALPIEPQPLSQRKMFYPKFNFRSKDIWNDRLTRYKIADSSCYGYNLECTEFQN